MAWWESSPDSTRRSLCTTLNSSGESSNSSLRVPEGFTSTAGNTRRSEILRSSLSSALPVPLNYVGKPLAYVLATPEQPDDKDNPLKVAFGNEASDRDIAEFSQRFDCTVWDGFGSSEGAIIITREDGCPPGSLGQGFPGVSIYNSDTLDECAVAEFDDHGTLINPDDAIGELVNTTGAGLFA